MYRIMNDKRVIATKEKIFQEVIKCQTKEEFNNLTISKICEDARISRASFYRSYDNTLDVLDCKLNTLFTELQTSYINKNKSFSQKTFFTELAHVYMHNIDLFNILSKLGESDIIYKNVSILSKTLYQHSNFNFERKLYDFCIGIVVSVLSGGIFYWKPEMVKQSPEELINTIHDSLAALLKD